MTAPDQAVDANAAEVDACVDLLNRMSINRIDPEAFHVKRDEIAKRLRRVADSIRGVARTRATHVWRNPHVR